MWISPPETAAGRPIIVTGHYAGSANLMRLLYSCSTIGDEKLDVLFALTPRVTFREGRPDYRRQRFKADQ
jgi:hypothetical protein